MPIDVLAPPLGTTVDTVTLVNWYKQEGETVKAGEPLFAVETDKATLDVEAPASGILREVACLPGEQVQVLTRIAIIETAVGAGLRPAPTKEPDGPEGEGHAPLIELLEVGAGPRPTPLIEPPGVGEGLRPVPTTEPAAARLSGVRQVREGPHVGRSFISPRAKRMAEAKGVEWKTLKGTGPEGAIVERDVQAQLEARPAPKITPVAERLAAEAGVDLTQIAGTGVGGRITHEDVARLVAAQGHKREAEPAVGAAPPTAGPRPEVLETVPVTGVRALIGERMAQSSAQTARVTLTAEADATGLVELRASLKTDGIEVSYNDLFIAILARALREHPRLNASLQDGEIKVWKSVHIGACGGYRAGLDCAGCAGCRAQGTRRHRGGNPRPCRGGSTGKGFAGRFARRDVHTDEPRDVRH